MFIVDRDIKELIDQEILKITVDVENPPFNPSKQIGPSTVDLRLSRVFRKYKPRVDIIDLNQELETEIIEFSSDEEIIIQPGELILGLTVEEIKLPSHISGIIAARSSIARLGLSVVEQPFIHPGYEGSIALQLKNNIDRPIKIKPLTAICQVMFLYGSNAAEMPYGSKENDKYQGESIVPKASQISIELDKNREIELTTIDFALVTALPEERDAVLNKLDIYETIQFDYDPITYYRGRVNIPNRDEYYEVVVNMLSEMGNQEAAVTTMEVLRQWQPKNVIMVGIAGGVPEKVKLGDIVVAQFIFYYELAKKTLNGEQRRARYFDTDRLLYDRTRSYRSFDWKNKISIKPPNTLHLDNDFPKVHFGAIASGEKVVADAKTLAQLRKECPELLAIGMEGAGVARAANHQHHAPSFLEIRSICDYADAQKVDDWHTFAAEVAATFTINFLRSRPTPPVTREKGNQ